MMADWIKLARPANALVAGLGVWLGHACLPGPMDRGAAGIGSAALALLAAAGNVQNEVLDMEADRINRPGRSIPAGRVPRRGAAWGSVLHYLLALSAAFSLGARPGMLAAAMGLLLCLYNLGLKTRPLWGNLAVSALCAQAVYYPEFPGMPRHTAFPALFAFLTTLIREILKDAEDMAGDMACGWNTFPIRFGPAATRMLAGLLTALVLLILPLPALVTGYRMGYAVLALLGPAPLLAVNLKDLGRADPDWGKLQRRCKWVMLAGMLAIFAGVYGKQ
jgi:geranylgeranylglycerol-phosphate geranylgeranyltransferase